TSNRMVSIPLMVQVRDAAATKDRILKAAIHEFTESGFAGTRVDEIAARAQCNKALLYQYYGDKEALFKHVLECKMAELARLQIERMICGGDPYSPEALKKRRAHVVEIARRILEVKE